MVKKIIISVIVGAILCCACFYWGKKSVIVDSEVRVEIDTLIIDNTVPPEVQPTDEYKVLYFDVKNELIGLRDSVSNIEPRIVYDTIKEVTTLYIPLSDYTFTDDSTYIFKARGYNVSLISGEVYNRNVYETKSIMYSPIWNVDIYYKVSAYSDGVFGSALGVSVERELFNRVSLGAYVQQGITGDRQLSAGAKLSVSVFRK